MSAQSLPAAAFAAALACAPGAGPAWLVEVLARYGPEQAWQALRAGVLAPPANPNARNPNARDPNARYPKAGNPTAGTAAPGPPAEAFATLSPAAVWRRCEAGGIQVTWRGAPGYPSALVHGPMPPGVLFWVGRIGALERPCVAVVGTRRCTPEGASVAYQLGYDLSSAGACVVSGLAAGIDGAAHAGALAAVQDGAAGTGSTVGVAASGVDVPYPPQHRALWEEVARRGAVMSETPPGRPAQAWRFPSRNRVIAGLARMVVVVESHARGGSWHTVEAALRHGVEVGAVPGSVHSPASVGTNTLLHEGALPVRSAQDVLEAIGLGLTTRPSPGGGATLAGGGPGGPVPGVLERDVLCALGWRPRTLDQLVEHSGLPLGAVVVALERLEQAGLVAGHQGWWARNGDRRNR